MPRTFEAISPADLGFLEERHLATLTTTRPNGTLHVVAIAFTLDHVRQVASVICSEGTVKVRNVDAGSRAAVCQVDGPRWMSLEGPARVVRDDAGIAAAVAAFERRYRPASVNPRRVAIEIQVEAVLGRS